MSGSVQTEAIPAAAPLSPILQERKDQTNSAQKKRPFHYNHHFQQYQKHSNHWKHKNEQFLVEADKNGKKRQKVQLPNKFLLGGNISDPLNLNSLLNENTSTMGDGIDCNDPKDSPQMPPYRNDIVNLILRPNIKDPLNLEGTYDGDRSNLLVKRHRKHRRSLCKVDDLMADGDIGDEVVQVNDEKPTGFPAPQTAYRNQHNGDSKRKRAHSFSVGSTATGTTTTMDDVDDDDVKCVEHFKAKRMLSDSFLNKSIKERSFDNYTEDDSDADSDNGEEMDYVNVLKTVEPSATTQQLPPVTMTHGSVSVPVTPNKRKHSSTSVSVPNGLSGGVASGVTATAKPKKQFNKNDFKFRYGNYNRYYGYRNTNDEYDHRLDHLKQEWFKDKSVLDIGCNVGHVTLYIAKTFEPKSIVGIDIDAQLIFAARKNIHSYIDKIECEQSKYPASFKINYGSLMSQQHTNVLFPKNVFFTQCNYVPATNDQLKSIKPEYDFVLALSLTKWIHLNWGDDGIKRFFQKIYLNLHPGGSLLLEPQSWASYKKKAKLTKETFENYQNIKFKPNEFTKYLLSKEVGFSSCKTVATPFNKSKGFRRSILLFTKLETARQATIVINSSVEAIEANANT